MVQERSDRPPREHLSAFQREKLIYYFEKFFDHDNSGLIELSDFTGLFQRILAFTGWEPSSRVAEASQELHTEFFGCLVEKIDTSSKKVSAKISKDQWLDMWGSMTRGSMSMGDFPYWVQLLPRMLFAIVDKKHDGVIDFEELRDFYENFVGIAKDNVEKQTRKAFNAMTANQEYPLDTVLYAQIFANFLLGKNIHGPGKYIFGCFDVNTTPEPFRITV